jgi:hypothetical protein
MATQNPGIYLRTCSEDGQVYGYEIIRVMPDGSRVFHGFYEKAFKHSRAKAEAEAQAKHIAQSSGQLYLGALKG